MPTKKQIEAYRRIFAVAHSDTEKSKDLQKKFDEIQSKSISRSIRAQENGEVRSRSETEHERLERAVDEAWAVSNQLWMAKIEEAKKKSTESKRKEEAGASHRDEQHSTGMPSAPKKLAVENNEQDDTKRSAIIMAARFRKCYMQNKESRK